MDNNRKMPEYNSNLNFSLIRMSTAHPSGRTTNWPLFQNCFEPSWVKKRKFARENCELSGKSQFNNIAVRKTDDCSVRGEQSSRVDAITFFSSQTSKKNRASDRDRWEPPQTKTSAQINFQLTLEKQNKNRANSIIVSGKVVYSVLLFYLNGPCASAPTLPMINHSCASIVQSHWNWSVNWKCHQQTEGSEHWKSFPIGRKKKREHGCTKQLQNWQANKKADEQNYKQIY